MEPTKYELYVDNQLVDTCYEWLEAHDKYLHAHSEENTGLSVYVSINGKPMWGITPDSQDSTTRKRLKMQRTLYLKKQSAK